MSGLKLFLAACIIMLFFCLGYFVWSVYTEDTLGIVVSAMTLGSNALCACTAYRLIQDDKHRATR